MARGPYIREEERQRIAALFRAGHRKAAIAERVRRPKCTIDRVLREVLGSGKDHPKPKPAPIPPPPPKPAPVSTRAAAPRMTEHDVLRARRPCNQRYVDWTDCPMAQRWKPYI